MTQKQIDKRRKEFEQRFEKLQRDLYDYASKLEDEGLNTQAQTFTNAAFEIDMSVHQLNT